MAERLGRRELVLREAFEEIHRIEKENLWFRSLSVLLKALSIRDAYTEGHSRRVAVYSFLLGKALGFSGELLERVYIGAFLHDIGKIGIPDAILLKPTFLTSVERKLVQKHPLLGFELLKDKERELPRVLDIILKHHERLDGRGYPLGLSGDEIPLYVNVVSVSDVFDALTTDRPYRKAISLEKALSAIEEDRGKAFYPEVADVALNVLETVGVLDVWRNPLLTEDLENFRKQAFFRDLVTGFPSFSQWKKVLFSSARRKDSCYASLDVKGLLFVNLTRGWDEGDRILSDLGSEIRKEKVGSFCRFTGGTFLGVLPCKKAPLLERVVNRVSVRHRVAIYTVIASPREVKFNSPEEFAAALIKKMREKKSLTTKGGIEKLLRKRRK